MSAVNGVGKSGEALSWRVGLVNGLGRYLTAEVFGHKINASGPNLKKRQQWILVQVANSDADEIYIMSHLNCFLSSDRQGKVTCDKEEKGQTEKFIIVYHPDGSGRVAFKSKEFNLYFGGTEDNLTVFQKDAGPNEWWTLHLAVHPQVNLRSVGRKKYAHLKDDQVQVDELIPWGADALITLEFYDGKFAVRTFDNRYLHRDGHLENDKSKDTLFTLEFKSSGETAVGMALKDCTGRYLTGVGQYGKMQSKNKNVQRDELFTIEDSHPQLFFTAHNGKKVSTKQGLDLSANQDGELGDTETFQVEYDKNARKWRIRTSEKLYWSRENQSGIQNVGDSTSPTGLFDLEWQDDGSVHIKANNDRYVTAKLNGSLYAVVDNPSEKERFYMTVVNRPILVLRGDHGFIGFKTQGSTRLECNRSTYDPIYLEHTNGQNGEYYFKGTNGKYCTVDAESNLNADSPTPHPFFLELHGQSKFAIKTNGRYLKGEQNGIIKVSGGDAKSGSLWEY